jgi:multiple sugar transport system ATP-binding protein
MSLGDRIVVLNDGKMQQVGAPLEVFHEPINRFVGGFIGSPPMNFFDGKLLREDSGVWFDEGDARIRLPEGKAARLDGWVGKDVVLGVRPQAMGIENEGRYAGEDNSLNVTVNVVEPLGELMDLYFSTANHADKLARVSARTDIEPGQKVPLYLAMPMAHIFEPGEDGANLTAEISEPQGAVA